MRRFFLIALIFVPLAATFLIVRQWTKSNDRPRVRQEEASNESPISSVLSLAESSGLRSFFVSWRTADIDETPRNVPGRYWFLETWKKEPGDLFVATGLTMILLPVPSTQAQADALPAIEVTDGAVKQHAALQGLIHAYPSVTALHAQMTGGDQLNKSDDVSLRGEVRIETGPEGRRTVLTSEDAHTGVGADGLKELEIQGPFNLLHPDLALTGVGFSATPDRMIAESNVTLLWKGRTNTELRAGGPLTFTPAPQAGAAEDWSRLQLDDGELSIKGGATLNHGGFTVSGNEATGHLSSSDSNRAVSGPELIVFRGDVSVATGGWIATSSEARLTRNGGGELVVRLLGSPIVIRHSTKATQPRAIARGAIEIRELPRSSTAPDLPRRVLVTLEEGVVLHLHEGEPERGELRSDRAQIVLADQPSNRADQPAATRLAFAHCEAKGRVAGRFNRLNLAADNAKLTAQTDPSGRLTGHDLLTSGKSELTWQGKAVSNHTQSLHSNKSLLIHDAASPYGSSHFNAEGAVRYESKTGTGGKRVLTAQRASGTFVPALIVPVGASRARQLDHLAASGDVHVREEGVLSVRCDHLRLDDEATVTTAVGKPAVAVYGKKLEQQTIRASNIVWNSGQHELVADGSVEGDFLFQEILLLSVERTERGAITSGPFATTPGRPLKPWSLRANRLEAKMTSEGGSLAIQHMQAEGGLTLTNPNQQVEAELLVADLRQGTGWARGQPVRIRVTKPHGESVVVDTVVAPWVLMGKDSILLKGACHATLHLRKPGDQRGPARMEKVVVTCDKDILIKEDAAFFSGRTHMVRGNPRTNGLDMTCNKASVRLKGDNPATGAIDRIEGYGDVRLTSGSLVGSGDVMVFDDAQQLVHLSAISGDCTMTLGSNITETSTAICYNMRTKSLKSYGVRGGLKK